MTLKRKVDIIARAEEVERRVQKEESARAQAGYPLQALLVERRAVVELRGALATAVCALLELCRPNANSGAVVSEPTSSAAGTEGGGRGDGGTGALRDTSWRCQSAEDARGPASMLVQMVCSGDNASVRCATTAYRLSTGSGGGRGSKPIGTHDHHRDGTPNPPTSGEPSCADAAATFNTQVVNTQVDGPLTNNGTLLTTGILNPSPTTPRASNEKESHDEVRLRLPSVSVPSARSPHSNVEQALRAARAAYTSIESFATEICLIGGDRIGGGIEGEIGAELATSLTFNDGAGSGTWDNTTTRAHGKMTSPTDGVDTTATAKMVDALRLDASWVASLPTFVYNKLEAETVSSDNLLSLK